MVPEREEKLIEWSDELQQRLRGIHVPAVNPGHQGSVGIPSSCVGRVTSFLAAHLDMQRFREFLSQIHHLDPMTAQNPNNPQEHHRVLRSEVEMFLSAHPDLEPQEVLYVLSWVRRWLPDRSQQEHSGPPHRSTPGRTSPPASRPPRTSHQEKAAAAPPPKAPQEPDLPRIQVWNGAKVSYERGRQVLLANVPGQPEAASQAGRAQDLLAELDEATRNDLTEKRKKRKSLLMDVTVERLGKSWILVSLQEGKPR